MVRRAANQNKMIAGGDHSIIQRLLAARLFSHGENNVGAKRRQCNTEYYTVKFGGTMSKHGIFATLLHYPANSVLLKNLPRWRAADSRPYADVPYRTWCVICGRLKIFEFVGVVRRITWAKISERQQCTTKHFAVQSAQCIHSLIPSGNGTPDPYSGRSPCSLPGRQARRRLRPARCRRGPEAPAGSALPPPETAGSAGRRSGRW